VGDLAVGTTTITRLQRVVSCLKDFCDEWNPKINACEVKIVGFKKGGKLSRAEKWWWGDREMIEVEKGIKYQSMIWIMGVNQGERENR
jgi:hypothetical protein